MNRILMILPLLGALAGCDQYGNSQMSNNQLASTAGGAVLGAVVTPHNPLQGALIGSAVGLAAGSLLSRQSNGECLYQRPDGTRYTSRC